MDMPSVFYAVRPMNTDRSLPACSTQDGCPEEIIGTPRYGYINYTYTLLTDTYNLTSSKQTNDPFIIIVLLQLPQWNLNKFPNEYYTKVPDMKQIISEVLNFLKICTIKDPFYVLQKNQNPFQYNMNFIGQKYNIRKVPLILFIFYILIV